MTLRDRIIPEMPAHVISDEGLSLADLIRATHADNPKLSQPDIARLHGTSRQYVNRVLATAAEAPKRMGRPRKPRCPTCGHVLSDHT